MKIYPGTGPHATGAPCEGNEGTGNTACGLKSQHEADLFAATAPLRTAGGACFAHMHSPAAASLSHSSALSSAMGSCTMLADSPVAETSCHDTACVILGIQRDGNSSPRSRSPKRLKAGEHACHPMRPLFSKPAAFSVTAPFLQHSTHSSLPPSSLAIAPCEGSADFPISCLSYVSLSSQRALFFCWRQP